MKAIVGHTAVASRDGVAIEPGALSTKRVPVTREFDPRKVVGFAEVAEQADGRIMATFEPGVDWPPDGLYPSLGFIAHQSEMLEDGTRLIRRLDLLTVGLTRSPNSDPCVPPIGGRA
jgi:hypothetical protein